MSMYKGPYVFEYIGALMQWLCLILFSKKYRNKKGLFKKILAGNGPLAERTWETFFSNFFIGMATIVLIVTIIIVYLKI